VHKVEMAFSSMSSTKQRLTIQQVKQLPREQFIGKFKDLFEHHPIIGEIVYDKYYSQLQNVSHVKELIQLFQDALDEWLSWDENNALQLIRSHPKLGASKLSSQPLTANSFNEQSMTGLIDVSAEEIEEFNRLNSEYSDKFGFPFIVCVRAQGRKEAILNAFRTRLLNDDPEKEIKTALEQIKMIAGIRLSDLVEDVNMHHKL